MQTCTLHDWIQYKLYTSGARHENQSARNSTTGRSLCQGDSSFRSATAASVLARTTGTRACKLPFHCPRSSPSPEGHPIPCQKLKRSKVIPTGQNRPVETGLSLDHKRSGSPGGKSRYRNLSKKTMASNRKSLLEK